MGASGWDAFLDELTRQSGGVCTHMFGFDTEAQISMGLTASGYDPSYIETYNAHYAERNAWAPGFAEHDAGVFVDCEQMCPSTELAQTEFYNDWLRPQEEISTGGGVLLFKGDTRVFLLGGNIRAKDEDKLKDGWADLVRLMTPHMQQAFEVSRALAGAKLETMMATSQRLGEVPGIVVLTDLGRIVYANGIASEMIDRGSPIGVDLMGRLRLDGGRLPMNRIRDHLQISAKSVTFTLPGEADSKDYEVRLVRLSPDASPSLSFMRALGVSRECSVLLITGRDHAPDLATILRTRFQLTDAEAHVALLLAEGMSTREISEQREVSIHTVRHQVKTILQKVGVRRQTELVRRISEIL